MAALRSVTETAPVRSRQRPEGALREALRVGLSRTGVELTMLRRERTMMMLTFTLPLLQLLVFGSIFTFTIAPGVTLRQYFMAGLLASGIVYSTFQNLAIMITQDRDSGALKRLRGTPMPPLSYFIGKVGLVLTTYIAQVALMVIVGALLFGLPLPSAAGWMTFAWVSLLGLTACSLLGMALSGAIRNGRSAPAVVTPIVLVLQFASGVYIQLTATPGWMQTLASVFPLRWLAEGMRSVFLPAFMGAREPGGSFQLGSIALVLAAWTVAGLLLALRFFRWTPRDGR
jgi:ABC-2 type transport system permease protein